jgi:hypothetical protein
MVVGAISDRGGVAMIAMATTTTTISMSGKSMMRMIYTLRRSG